MRASLGHTMQYILQASQDTACVHHLATQCSTYCRQARTQHACITWPHNAVHIAGKPGHSMRASLGHTMQYILQASQDTACVHHLATMQYILQATQDTACVHHLATQCSTYCRQARTQHACITWPQCSTYCRQARTQHACITWPQCSAYCRQGQHTPIRYASDM